MPLTVRNEPLWQKRCRKVRALAQRITSGEIGVIEGSRQMLIFQGWLHATDDADFRVFEAINSESNHLPVGKFRKHWEANALKTKDKEIAALEKRYGDSATAAAARIRAKYR